MKKLIFILSLLGGTAFATPVQTAKFVDLNQYLGKWYEIASIPQSFQKQCAKNTQAEYSLAENGRIKVYNSCQTAEGRISAAEGRAKIVDPATNSKLKVTFVRFFSWIFAFGGDYWILDVAPDYSYAVVGDPTRHYAWILARTPTVSDDVLDEAGRTLTREGYDTCQLLTSIQDGGLDERIPLCQVLEVR